MGSCSSFTTAIVIESFAGSNDHAAEQNGGPIWNKRDSAKCTVRQGEKQDGGENNPKITLVASYTMPAALRMLTYTENSFGPNPILVTFFSNRKIIVFRVVLSSLSTLSWIADSEYRRFVLFSFFCFLFSFWYFSPFAVNLGPALLERECRGVERGSGISTEVLWTARNHCGHPLSFSFLFFSSITTFSFSSSVIALLLFPPSPFIFRLLPRFFFLFLLLRLLLFHLPKLLLQLRFLKFLSSWFSLCSRQVFVTFTAGLGETGL